MVVRVHGGIIDDQMLTGSLRYFDITDAGGLGTDVIGPSANQRAEWASVAAPGSGYAIDDVLTLAGTTAGTAATFTVKVVGGAGEVLGVQLTLPGDMTTIDPNPVPTTVAPANGTGCELHVSYTSLLIVPGASFQAGVEVYVGVGKPVPNSAADQCLNLIQHGASGDFSGSASIVQVGIVSANVIRIAVENTGFSWDTPDGGDAAAEMQAAIRLLSTVTVPDTSNTGTTFDFAGALVVESTFAAL